MLQADNSLGMAVIMGMAGVGKTELALQYGRSHQDTYQGGVIHLPAANFGEALRNWMQVEFYCDRDLRHLPELTQQVAPGWKEWQNYCGTHRQALVIIDDVTDYRRQVAPFLPQDAPSFRFLLTSRLRIVSPTPIPTLELKVLEPESAIAMLSRYVGEQRINADRQRLKLFADAWAIYRLPLISSDVG
ncbi:MAG: hypothetical protein IGR76_06535 [Synechococcales cyanobacterium T60_A2020_003]|nr:hypothetical protein [Synechococcales cyanobacterium T60_A2020_003]